MNNRYCVWPDGTVCEYDDLWDYNWKSDDFAVIWADDEYEARAIYDEGCE